MQKNIYDYYEELLRGKDLTIPNIKSWELIKEKNKNRLNYSALSENGKEITYEEMFDKWKQSAKAFSSLGIKRVNHSRVLVLMPNVVETCYIDYGLDMTGAVCDFIDPTSSYDKIKKYVESEKITDIVMLDLLYASKLSKKVEELNVENIIVYHSKFMNSMFPKKIKIFGDVLNKMNRYSKKVIRMEDAIRDSRYERIIYDTSDSNDMSLITHTSGTTTGMGKPIPLTDYNRNALVKQYELAKFSYRPGMKMLHFIPYFAGYGSVNTTHLGLAEGMCLQQIPVFSPDKFPEILLKNKPNIVLANTPCWLNLVKNPIAQNADLSFLTYASSGGTSTSKEDENLINDFLKNHGCKVLLTKGYGLSELGGCCVTTIDDFNEIGSPGVPLPLVDMRIRNLENGKIDCIGKEDLVGEALVHSNSMTNGILDGKTIVKTEIIDGKRFLSTKDVLKVYKNGIVEYIERTDKMFPRYDAYNVYPKPIEDLLKSYNQIKNCVIVPVFNESKNGFVPRIYVELNEKIENKEIFIEQLINDLFINNKNIDGYKANFRDIPWEWIFVLEIPKNTMGKEDYYTLKNCMIDGEKYNIIVEENNMSVKNIKIEKEIMDVKRLNKKR